MAELRGSTAMGFDHNRNAAAAAQLCEVPENLHILHEGKNIASRMAVYKNNVTLGGKLELRFEAPDMFLAGLSLSQNLTDQAQSVGSMLARNLRW